MNQVASKMIRIDKSSEFISLDDFLLSTGQVPISMFGKPSKATIGTAIDYMKDNGGGSIRIPATDVYNVLIINVMRNKEREYQVQFVYQNYRPPIGNEGRPYTGDDWQTGDVVYNMDLVHSDDKTIYWYCLDSGTPGYWNFLSDKKNGDFRDAEYVEDEEMIVII